MSSLPDVCASASRVTSTNRDDADSSASSRSVHECDTASEPKSTPGREPALARPATRPASCQPSEDSDKTILGAFYDGGAPDNAPSVALRDEFPWHVICLNEYMQRIPAIIVPALLQPGTSLDGDEDKPCGVNGDSDDIGDDVLGYCALQRGKWKAEGEGDAARGNPLATSPSPQLHLTSADNSVLDWAAHTRPILHDYADRQTSLPLGRRLEVSMDEPPEFILGAIQLLVNRDKKNCTDRSRQLGPQLIENFVDIDRWAKDYFRYHHDIQAIDSDIPALLTIVMNNFYEGVVQLIDRLVDFALENMHFCGRSNLQIEDFAFGFDFRMSQDLPFYVETSSRIRKPLPIRTVEVQPTSEPVTTSFGRQVKPTARAQSASQQAQTNSNGRRNRWRNATGMKDKQASKASVPSPCQKKSSIQTPFPRRETPIGSRTGSPAAVPAPSKATSAHTKHRPTQPSTLGGPPMLPGSSSAVGTTPSQSNDSSKSEPSASVSVISPKVSTPSGSNLTVDKLPRLKIIIRRPGPGLPTSIVATTSGSEASKTNSLSSQKNPPKNASETIDSGPRAPRSEVARPRGPRDDCGRGHGQGRGSASATPSGEAAEATSDDTKALQTANPVNAGNTEALAAADSPVAPPVPRDELKSTGTTSRTQSSSGNHGIGKRDDSPSTPLRLRKEKPPRVLTDPGHSRAQKRKLDDCED